MLNQCLNLCLYLAKSKIYSGMLIIVFQVVQCDKNHTVNMRIWAWLCCLSGFCCKHYIGLDGKLDAANS